MNEAEQPASEYHVTVTVLPGDEEGEVQLVFQVESPAGVQAVRIVPVESPEPNRERFVLAPGNAGGPGIDSPEELGIETFAVKGLPGRDPTIFRRGKPRG